jgi:hypothetical protein
MTVKIDKKIVGCSVDKSTTKPTGKKDVGAAGQSNVVQMHEKLERPAMLSGVTYKINTPLSEHALYVTINDIILNPGTEHELRRPFEIFINSKNMDHFQWIVALTRIISAIFRKGGDITFLVEELHSVFDPKGGYFKKGGKFMPSLVAEIGDVLEHHLKNIGLIKEGMDPHTRKYLEEKRKDIATRDESGTEAGGEDEFPPNAMLCNKCYTRAMVNLEGCLTCLNCGESKCG